MTPEVVTRWLGALRVATARAEEVDIIERGTAQIEVWAARGDPRAAEAVARLSTELGTDAARGELRREMENSMTSLDLVSRARLFTFSDEILDAAGRKATTLVGAPDLSELPFEVCWFHMDCAWANVKMLGCLITRDGWFGAYLRRADGDFFECIRAVDKEGWDPASIPTVWALWLLSRVAAGHVAQRTPVGSFAVRREMTKARLLGAPLAPPPNSTRSGWTRAARVTRSGASSRLATARRTVTKCEAMNECSSTGGSGPSPRTSLQTSGVGATRSRGETP